MASKKKLLQAAAGSAGGGTITDVDDVFSTFLYDGNGVGNSIENGINLGDDTEERVLLNLSGDTLTDTGPNTLTISNSGVSVNTSTKKYGTGSLRFNGSATATVTDASLILGTSDFTIEFWLYLDSLVLKGIFNIGNPSDHTDYSIGMYVNSDGTIAVQYRNTPNNMGQFSTSAATASMSANTWHHVAIVRHNNTLSAYLDGSVVGTDDISGTTVGWNQLELGTHWGTSGGDDFRFTGYIDDFRISKKAVYTANFTAPSSAHSTSYTSTTGEGGLVWIKRRGDAVSHTLFDTARGATKRLFSNLTNAEATESTALTSFNSNGFTVGSAAAENNSGSEIVSWTWRKAPKFFDVVKYTADGVNPKTISHNLGSVPGMIIVKALDNTSNNGAWKVYHRKLNGGTNPTDKVIQLHVTDEETTSGAISSFTSTPTSTTFSVGTDLNTSGEEYIAYIFAHNDGDGNFGPDGDADIIKCDSYTGTGSEVDVNLGFEPQWILTRRADDPDDWYVVDTMRGIVTSGNDVYLRANLSSAEGTGVDIFDVTSTGFKTKVSARHTSGGTYIYMAIRRGPLAEPESATDVFAIDTQSQSSAPYAISNFPVDFALRKDVDGSSTDVHARLTQGQGMFANSTSAEGSDNIAQFDYQNGYLDNTSQDTTKYAWMWKRAPSYFDVVCYTGTGGDFSAKNHNLGVVPEMIWIKNRTTSGTDWPVWVTGFVTGNGPSGTSEYLILNSTAAKASSTGSNLPFGADPTATTFTVGSWSRVNDTGNNYIAYLFASLDGISKVGSYTGDGTTSKNIDCGFSNGARFVMIRRTDSGGGWIVFDTVRGLTTAAADPFLYLDSTAAQSQNVAFDLDPYSSGFNIGGDAGYINASGGSYIFYAIA